MPIIENQKKQKTAKKSQKTLKFLENKQKNNVFGRSVKYQHDTIECKFNMKLMIAQQWNGVKSENMFVFWIVEGR